MRERGRIRRVMMLCIEHYEGGMGIIVRPSGVRLTELPG